MEKNKRKGLIKKVFVIICVLVLLQSYFVSFSYVVKAMDMTLNANTENEVTNNTVNPEEELLNEVVNNTVSNEANSTVVNNAVDNTTVENTTNEVVEPEVEEPVIENTVTEEPKPEEEPTVEEPVVEQPEEEPIIEEYVAPEVALEVTSENTSIYKGYLYANATSDLRYATNYNTIDKVTITGGKNMNSITIQEEPDKIELITNTKLGLLNDILYKQTRISVEEFKTVLGENGVITIYDSNNIVIGNINNQTNVQNGYYVFSYPSQDNSIKFEFTNIIGDGVISIKNDKAIKESSVFSRNQISLFSKINTITNIQMVIGEEIRNISAEGNINLEETESKMTIDIDNDTLSVENENEVAINVTLRTDEERYDLFKNPGINIEFPSAVKTVDITAINLLYKNGLSMDDWDVHTNEFGRKVLSVSLEGSQLEYTPGSVQEGTTLVIYAKLNVDRLTADTTENLKMTYSNKDTVRQSYVLEGKTSEDIPMNFVGRQELVKASQATLAGVGTATTYDDDVQKIQVLADSKTAQTVTLTGAIVNNFEATVEGVSIVGRIPFIGNKDGNGNDLGSNFDTILSSMIVSSGVVADIYYSEKTDVSKNDDSWTQDTTDISKYKSYKIVIKSGSMAKGEKLSFEYNVDVPAEVGYNAKSYSTYAVYYSLDKQEFIGNCTVGIVTEEKELTTDDIEEDNKEEVATLTVGTQVSQGGNILKEGDSVFERQILKYTVVVTNNSKVTANNITIKGNANNSNAYYFYTWFVENYEGQDDEWLGQYKEDEDHEKEYEEFKIESLAPGESKTFEYQVVVRDLKEIETPEVYGTIEINADNMEATNIETIHTGVKDAEAEIRLAYKGTEAVNQIDKTSKSAFYFKVYLKNLKGEKIENAKLVINIPNTLIFNEESYIEGADGFKKEIEKTVDGINLIIYIPEMDENYENYIYIPTKVASFSTDLESVNINVLSHLDLSENIYYSNDYSAKAYQSESRYEYSWTSDIKEETLNNNDIVTYTLSIKNKGIVNINFISFTDLVPSGLEIQEAVIKQIDKEDNVLIYNEENNKIYGTSNIPIGETIELIIKAKVNDKLFDKDQLTLENKITVNGGKYFDEFDTDVISYKIDNENISQREETEKPSEDDLDENLPDELEKPNDLPNSNEGTNPNDSSNPIVSENIDTKPVENIKTTYNISGKVWFDKNKDGIFANENGMKAIVVMLYGANSQGGIDTSKQIATTVTNENGIYIFTNVEAGNYVVVFNYDSSIYNTTKYQVKTATSSQNSDAISKKITSNGSSDILAMTDVLNVNNSSLIDVDLGLVQKNEFDLSLDKKITSVTVENKEESKTYNYKNGTSEKLEISSKNYKSSVLSIKYKITIKNEGELTGYINKLVDYLPDGTTVDLNENSGWYYGDDGNLYYNGLVGKEIEVGKTKEVELTLKMSLASGEASKVLNGAEIVEYTNSLGFADNDSVANNKEKSEDDYGEALLTISISTGKAIQNILIILVITIISSVIIVFIIKNKSTKKIYK